MPEVSATISDLELKIAAFASTDDENDTSALQSMVEENPDDHASRHRLASLLFQEGCEGIVAWVNQLNHLASVLTRCIQRNMLASLSEAVDGQSNGDDPNP